MSLNTPTTTFALRQIDAIQALKSLPDASVDLMVTDPAYESMEKHRRIGTTTRLKHSKASSNDWFTIFPDARFPEFFAEAFRVMKRNTHVYVFCNSDTMFVIKPIAEAAGFRFWKPIVWDKMKMGMGYHYRARYEFILFFEKGKRKLNNLGIPDVLQFARVYRGYPTEKPVEVSDVLVRQSTQPGQLVFDPFCGSGSAGVASVAAGRSFLGADISAEAIEVTRTRLIEARGAATNWPAPPTQSSLLG